MEKYRYNIINLDCATCARKIEEKLNRDSQFEDVVVNFNTSKLSYKSNEDISLENLNKIIKEIEPNVTITTASDIKQTSEYHFNILIVGLILGLSGAILKLPFNIKYSLIILSYIILLYHPFVNAVKGIIKTKSINENALISISCVGALLVGQILEGIMVVTLYLIGKILEEKAINNTRKSIKGILDLKQDYANRKILNKIDKVDVLDIKIDDTIIVKKGEQVPLDGVIIVGDTLLDMSALTGETDLVKTTINQSVLSGSINTGNIIEIKVTSLFKDSTVSKILELIEEATDKKASTETLVSKLSKIYTPIVLILACLVAITLPLILDISYSESIYRGLTFLVISCPCAIAISVPLSYFTGIGIASKNGILIKGSNYLDNLSHVKKIIFDKTGTLTKGSFEIDHIDLFDNSYNLDEINEILVKGESLSNHPIAKSFIKLSNKKFDNNVENFEEISGHGIQYKIDNKVIKVGSINICNDCKLDSDIHLNIDGKHVASIFINDGIKENARVTIDKLKKMGISILMFTGDKKEIAMEIGKNLNIDTVKYEMLPTDKYTEYEKVADKTETTVFVGDGINDAPVLKRADIGISMGSIGSASAIEASDIVIMNDDIENIYKGIKISKYTNYIIKQNLLGAITIKILILLLSIFGLASMWLAVFADTGVTLIAILNTIRIKRKFENK